MKKPQIITTKSLLIDLYLYIRDNESDKDNLKMFDSIEEKTIIKYIRDTIDSQILYLAEKKMNEYYYDDLLKQNTQEEYEALLLKHERDIRANIKTENQLKLYVDSLQNNIDVLEKEKKKHLNDIMDLKKEVQKYKKITEKYEEKIKSYVEMEKKYKKDMDNLDKTYKAEKEKLTKKIKFYENIFKDEDIEKKKKSSTINSNSFRNTNNNNNNNNLENDINIQNMNKTYRNMHFNYIGNNNSISNVSLEKVEKFKFTKINTNRAKHLNISNLKASTALNKNKYIINNNINKLIMNNPLLNNSNNNTKKSKKIYHRHKSIENIKNKPFGIIKKILMSNSINNSINKGHNNIINYINIKKIINNNGTINNNGLNSKGGGGKFNFVNNISIYSNNRKQNLHLSNNNKLSLGDSGKKLEKFSSKIRDNNNINNNNSVNNGKNCVNNRNKKKEKFNSSYTNI